MRRLAGAHSPWRWVGWMSLMIGVLVMVFLVWGIVQRPSERAEDKIPASAPQ
jgi:hypothetical protein